MNAVVAFSHAGQRNHGAFADLGATLRTQRGNHRIAPGRSS